MQMKKLMATYILQQFFFIIKEHKAMISWLLHDNLFINIWCLPNLTHVYTKVRSMFVWSMYNGSLSYSLEHWGNL